MRAGARTQFFRGSEPIFFRRSDGAASGLPEFVGQGRNLRVAKCGDAVPDRSPYGALARIVGMLLSSPGLLVPTQMFLLSVLLGNAMGMRGAVLQL